MPNLLASNLCASYNHSYHSDTWALEIEPSDIQGTLCRESIGETVSSEQLEFRYRENRDGTWDSICLRCFATASTARTPELAKELTELHQCLPESLIRYEKLSRSFRSKSEEVTRRGREH